MKKYRSFIIIWLVFEVIAVIVFSSVSYNSLNLGTNVANILQYYVPLQITESVVSIADGYNVLTLTKKIKE